MNYEISKKENTGSEVVEILQKCLGVYGTSVVGENELRLLLLELETHTLLKFNYEYIIDGSLNLEEKLNRIKKAKCGAIDEVITTLKYGWNIAISEPFL